MHKSGEYSYPAGMKAALAHAMAKEKTAVKGKRKGFGLKKNRPMPWSSQNRK